MNKKTLSIILKVAVILAVLIAVSGCSLLGDLFATYTVKVDTYIDGTWIFIEYRESGTTEWIDAELYDENGSVGWITYNDSAYPDEAYFDVPGAGTYDFRGVDILGYLEGDGVVADCVVEYSNQSMMDIYGHDLTISSLSSIHGFY